LARLTILLCHSPFHHESVDEAMEIGSAALAKGHEVDLYLMMDGVYCAYTKQSGEPFNVETVHARLTDLMAKGGRVVLCRVCAELRGVSEENTPKGVEMGGLFDLSESVGVSNAVLTFAGGA
jgi:sulfur relay (sulfurtransferase) complex TusBCD TusD component (DsrE family)